MRHGRNRRRNSYRTLSGRRARISGARSGLRIDALEPRLLLSGNDPQFAVNHTPRVQLGDAPLAPYSGSETDQIGIIWQTTSAGPGTEDQFVVSYREAGTGPWEVADQPTQAHLDSGTRISHSVEIVGLDYDTDYEYRVQHLRGADVIETYQATFHTRLAAGVEDGFTFTAYGDSSLGLNPIQLASWRDVAELNASIDPAFTLLLGDNVQGAGTLPEYDGRYDPALAPENAAYVASHVEYATAGNHDAELAHSKIFMAPAPVAGVTGPAAAPLGSQPDVNFSFDYGDVHFVSFDSEIFSGNHPEEAQTVLDWMAADLAASDAQWKVVFTHRAMVSRGAHAEEHAGSDYFKAIFPTLEAGGVDLLLTGHAHDYQRTFPLTGVEGEFAQYVEDLDNDYAKGAGVVQVTAGTGGSEIDRPSSPIAAPNVYVAAGESQHEDLQFGVAKISVTANQLQVEFHTIDGEILDTFTITDGPDLDAPTAELAKPLDNGPLDLDFDDGEVGITPGISTFAIQLADVPGGTGIDAATVASQTVSVDLDGVALTAGSDYTFAYDAASGQIRLTAVGGDFAEGRYTLAVNAGGSGIADGAGNALVPANFSIKVDASLPQVQAVSFRDGVNGYQGTSDTEIDETRPDEDLSEERRLTWAMPEYGEQANRYTLLKFEDVFGSSGDQVPEDATITRAVLTYYAAGLQATPADLYEVSVPWTETTTSNTFGAVPGVQLDDYASGLANRLTTAPPGMDGVNLDVTSSLRDWIADPTSNQGWVFAPYGRNGTKFFSSDWNIVEERPMLTVYYTDAATSGGPVADAGDDLMIFEGDTPTLSAGATTHPSLNVADLNYAWDFDGDLAFDDATGISAAFTKATDEGTHEVYVLVTDPEGRSSVASLTIDVQNIAPTLVVNGAGLITQGRSLSLFLDAIDPGDDTIREWTIDWGDGVVEAFGGTQSIVAHTYGPALTSYVVEVTATDEDGTYAADAHFVAITNVSLGPIADAGNNVFIGEGDGTLLDASGTTHPTQPIGTLSYEWDLDGDGIYDDATGITTDFTPPAVIGDYQVGLRVIDSGFYVATDTVTVTVVDVNPDVTISGPSVSGIGSQYVLFLESFDPGVNSIHSWEIDWGDGTVETISGNPVQWPHTYAAVPQVVTISATATDAAGTYASNSHQVTFTPAVVDDRDANFATTGVGWLPVPLNGNGANAFRDNATIDFSSTPGNLAEWTFNGLLDGEFEVFASWHSFEGTSSAARYDVFDGGQLAGGSTVNQSVLPSGPSWDGEFWQSLGIFDVENGSLRVTLADLDGGRISADAVRIVPTYTPSVGGPYTVVEGEALALDASSSFSPLPGDPVNYSWDLNGDGNFNDATGANPVVPWSQLIALGINDGPSSFAPRVRMTNLVGASSESSAGSLTVVNAPPVLTLDGRANEGAGLPFILNVAADDPSHIDDGATFVYLIDWDGDGTFDGGFNGSGFESTSHVYDTPGVRTIRAAVFDTQGGLSAIVEHTVEIAAPGDVNIDGVVDALDANAISINFIHGAPEWETGDLNGDGAIDGLDANILTEYFDPDGPEAGSVSGDINGDGTIDLLDADIVSANFGLENATLLDGDVTGDGRVDGRDANFITDRMGDVGGLFAGPVAEVSGTVAEIVEVAALLQGRNETELAATAAAYRSEVREAIEGIAEGSVELETIDLNYLVLRARYRDAIDALFAALDDDASE